jgi:tetratricopeptide (TPR) repeat protein
MGTVYKAWDRELERTVALKLIRHDLMRDPTVSQRFKQELLLASKISHRNVLRIHDLGDGPGDTKFISMACIDGQDLRQLLKKEGKLPLERALNIARQLCAALEAAHAEGVVHRDLKPPNILIDQHDHIYVSDFGLAKSLESDVSMTQTGQFLGTPRYMSPEQAEIRPVDHRSDLYAFGLILCEMVTGHLPFEPTPSVMQMMYQRVHGTAKDPRQLNPDVPEFLARIIQRCLERDVELRYQSAAELLADLDAGMAGAKHLWKKGSWTRVARALAHRQIPWRATAAAAVVVAVATIAGIFFIRGRPTVSIVHAPVSVLVADFTNHTGDPVFDGTLEPMFNVALEGASFVNAFSRGDARRLAGQLPHPTDRLDEQASRLIAVSQGINAVVIGSLSRRGDGYKISVEALDARTGNSIASSDLLVSNKDDVLRNIPKLAAPIRKALGDTTPESVQFNTISGGFTASSLEVVHLEAVGMAQQFEGKFEDALQTFSKAAELDPNFARAYSGMAASAINLDRQKEAEKYLELAMAHEDRMTERERYRNRGLFYLTTGNWQKCVDENTQLVDRYPAERVGLMNLATCLAQLRDIPKAVNAGREVVEIAPKSALYRLNYSFLSSVNGDFKTGEQEARAALQLNPTSEVGFLDLGEAQLGQGEITQATESYRQLEKVSAMGSSMAATALADLALYEGRFKDSIRMLEQGAAADLVAKNPDAAADKFAALAYTYLSAGKSSLAVKAAERALANSQAVNIRFLAARIFVEAGEAAKAQKLAAGLGSELQAEPQAYGKIIQGKVALKRGDVHGAIKALIEANNLLDTWIGRFELGRAYLHAGAFVEADSEFDRCIKRRGEALELFMNDVPTYGYFPLVYYDQGRVREGLKSPEFVSSYRTYLNIRDKAGEDPLLAEVRRRAGQ